MMSTSLCKILCRRCLKASNTKETLFGHLNMEMFLGAWTMSILPAVSEPSFISSRFQWRSSWRSRICSNLLFRAVLARFILWCKAVSTDFLHLKLETLNGLRNHLVRGSGRQSVTTSVPL